MQRPTWLALSKTSAGAAWRAGPLAGRQASNRTEPSRTSVSAAVGACGLCWVMSRLRAVAQQFYGDIFMPGAPRSNLLGWLAHPLSRSLRQASRHRRAGESALGLWIGSSAWPNGLMMTAPLAGVAAGGGVR